MLEKSETEQKGGFALYFVGKNQPDLNSAYKKKRE